MSLFDLVFLACALALLLSLGRLLYLLLRHRDIKSFASRIVLGLGLYFAALLTASALTPPRVYQPGEKKCSDDWCVSVKGASREGPLIHVQVTVLSDARRVTQREHGVSLQLIDQKGHLYQPVAESGPPLDSAIGPGERFAVSRTFSVPDSAHSLALVVKHSQGPGLLVIGDGESLFHQRPRMLLPAL